MSRNIKNVKNSTPVQKYCKVCHDAGKSEAEYRSHFTRESPDPKSKVLCPTLLALECRYCFKNGHTVKYCSVLKENEKKKKNEEFSARRTEAAQKATQKPKGKSNTSHNAFACLDSDSEEDEDNKPQEEFPMLSTPISRSESVSFNYAAALAKPAAPKVQEVLKTQEVVVPVQAAKVQAAKVQAAPAPLKTAPWASKTATTTSKSWAAWDSDSEDDEDNEFDDTPCCWDSQTVERDDFLDDETW
jgi:hypothetical protein